MIWQLERVINFIQFSIIRGNYGGHSLPLLVILGAKLYILGAVLPFALMDFWRCAIWEHTWRFFSTRSWCPKPREKSMIAAQNVKVRRGRTCSQTLHGVAEARIWLRATRNTATCCKETNEELLHVAAPSHYTSDEAFFCFQTSQKQKPQKTAGDAITPEPAHRCCGCDGVEGRKKHKLEGFSVGRNQ